MLGTPSKDIVFLFVSTREEQLSIINQQCHDTARKCETDRFYDAATSESSKPLTLSKPSRYLMMLDQKETKWINDLTVKGIFV